MQGVPNIRASTSIAGRLTWSFLFLVCMTLLSGHLYYLCYSYYSYPKHSVIELGFSALVFPAVTFCNVNPLKKSKLPETPERLRTLVSRTDPDEIAKKMVSPCCFSFFVCLSTNVSEIIFGINGSGLTDQLAKHQMILLAFCDL